MLFRETVGKPHYLPTVEFHVRHHEIIMSIYATLWSLKLLRYGDIHTGCEWIKVTAQGMPPLEEGTSRNS